MYTKILLSIFLFFATFTFCQTEKKFSQLKKEFKNQVSKSNRDSADFYLNQMFTYALKIKNDSLLMVSYDQKAYINFVSGDFKNSAQELIKAIEIALDKNYITEYLNKQHNLASIFSKLGEYKKSNSIYKKVLALSDSTNINRDYIATVINIGSTYQNLENFDNAEAYLKKGLLLSKSINDSSMIASSYKFLAKNSLLRSKYLQVIDYVNIIENDYQKNIPEYLVDDAYFYRAEAYYKLNQLKKSETAIKKLFSLKSIFSDPSTVERYLLFSKIKEKQQDFKGALHFKNLAIKLKDSLDEANVRKSVIELERKYQLEKKEKENLQLKKDSYFKDLKISKKNIDILFIVIGFTTLICFIIFYYLTKYRKSNIALKKSIEKGLKLENKLATVRENIAQDFHDDLGNKLASITVLTDVLSKKIEESENKKIVKKIQDNSDGLYKGTKDFIWALNTKSDYLEELITYLSDFGEDFFHKLDISFTIKKNIESNILLPPYWSRHLILIFKEAMTNVAKHSKAKDCEIQFFCDNTQLKISLVDDGIGFCYVGKSFENGLENMKKRASKINGELEIKSNNNGTRVIFRSKLPKEGS